MKLPIRTKVRSTILAILQLLHLDLGKIQLFLFGFEKTFDECKLVESYFSKQFRSGGVLIDIGVAWGSVSLPFLKKGWRVFGFEPDVSETKQSRLAELTVYGNFVLENAAVSNVSGDTLKFYHSKESEGISSLHEFREHEFSHEVSTITLKDYFTEKSITDVQFLKIDVEGHERWVLEGLGTSTVRPEIIVMEFDEGKSEKLGYDQSLLGDWLLSAGYAVYRCEWKPIERYGMRHTFLQVKRYPGQLLNEKGWGNFIGVEQSQDADFSSARSTIHA